jgi:hypothetical protein
MSTNASSSPRLSLLIAVTTVALLACAQTAFGFAFNEPLVKPTGPEQVAFDYSSQACVNDDIPDIPARAFRDSAGRTQLIVSHYNTRREIGTTLDNVAHDCSVVLGSSVDPDPSHYDDAEWIHSIYTEDGTTVHGFIHEEYQGWNFLPECAALMGTPDINKCWYNSITYAVSTNRGDSFTQPAVPNQLVASVPYKFAPLQGPSGIYRPTNIVAKDGWYYMMVMVEPVSAQERGVCLMRTQTLADPTSWRAWDGTGFTRSFINPYVDTTSPPEQHVCAPVSSAIVGPLRGLEIYSLTYNTYFGKYLLLGAAMKDPTGQIGGFYFTLSDDLVHWSEPRLLMDAEIPQVSHKCGDPNPVRDASLLDPDSPARNFETTGKRANLYYTRFNYFYDTGGNCSMTLDRDLIKVPIEFDDPTVNQPPVAEFTASPDRAAAGQTVVFDASASSDPDGSIVDYSWDLDGDGSFETDTGTSRTIAHAYPTVGTVSVRLRVTDDRQNSSETSREVIVWPPGMLPPSGGPPTGAIPGPTSSTKAPGPTCAGIAKQRKALVKLRSAAKRKLAKAKTVKQRRHYRKRVKSLNRRIKRLATQPCS